MGYNRFCEESCEHFDKTSADDPNYREARFHDCSGKIKEVTFVSDAKPGTCGWSEEPKECFWWLDTFQKKATKKKGNVWVVPLDYQLSQSEKTTYKVSQTSI